MLKIFSRIKRMRKSLCALIFFVGLLAGAVLSLEVRVLLRYVTDYVAFGLSNVKIYAWLGTFVAFFALRVLKTKIHWNIKRWWIMVLFGLFFLGGVVTHGYFIARYQLNFWKINVVVAGDYFSGTQLTHSHLLKPTLSVLGAPFGLANPGRTWDDGIAFFNFMPHWIYYALAPLFVLAGLLLILYWLQTIDKIEKSWKLTVTLIYLTSSFMLFKSLVDGGLFCKEVFVALPFWLVSSAWSEIPAKKSLSRLIGFLEISAVLFLAVFCLEIAERGEFSVLTFGMLLQYFLVTTSLLAVPFLFFHWSKKQYAYGLIYLVPIILYFVFWPLPFTAARSDYLATPIATNDPIFLLSPSPLSLPNEVAMRHQYLYQFSASQPEKIADLIKKYNLHEDYFPIGVDPILCQADIPTPLPMQIILSQSVAAELPAYFATSNLFYLKSWRLISAKTNGQAAYEAEVDVNSCLLVSRSALYQFLDGFRFQPIIIVPEGVGGEI